MKSDSTVKPSIQRQNTANSTIFIIHSRSCLITINRQWLETSWENNKLGFCLKIKFIIKRIEPWTNTAPATMEWPNPRTSPDYTTETAPTPAATPGFPRSTSPAAAHQAGSVYGWGWRRSEPSANNLDSVEPSPRCKIDLRHFYSYWTAILAPTYCQTQTKQTPKPLFTEHNYLYISTKLFLPLFYFFFPAIYLRQFLWEFSNSQYMADQSMPPPVTGDRIPWLSSTNYRNDNWDQKFCAECMHTGVDIEREREGGKMDGYKKKKKGKRNLKLK